MHTFPLIFRRGALCFIVIIIVASHLLAKVEGFGGMKLVMFLDLFLQTGIGIVDMFTIEDAVQVKIFFSLCVCICVMHL